MIEKLVRPTLRALSGFSLLLCVLLAITYSTRTPPFVDASGKEIAGSIAEERRISINGSDQWILIRGRDRTSPVLLVLHGGPGTTEMPLFRVHNSALEDHLIVVHWDQRGTGKSFDTKIPRETMTIEQFVSDLDVLIDYLRSSLNTDKVVILAHSWGTILGTMYAYQHPEKVSAYLGTGQIASMARSETEGYSFVLSEARHRGDSRAVRTLEDMGPPPYSLKAMLTQRNFVNTYGGAFHKKVSLRQLVWDSLSADEASWPDLIWFLRGEAFSLETMYDEIFRVDLAATLTVFRVPVAFLLGKHDRQISSSLSAAYFEEIRAPAKRLVWFEESAHSPPFEEPARFNTEVLNCIQAFGVL